MTAQRERILDETLALMSTRGARGTSMRAVAAATGLNVATLYHYFPSKRDLLQAAIAHRRVADLPPSPFPEGLAGSVEARLGALLDHLFVGMTDDEDLWRTLLAEAIHGDDDVLQPLVETADAFEHALGRVATRPVPRRAGAVRSRSRARVAQRRDRRARRASPATRRPSRRVGRTGPRARARVRARRTNRGGPMTAPSPPFELDAIDPTLYVRGVAHDVFRWMREHDPVHRDDKNGLWIVTKYDDVSYVERQPDLFCSAQGVRPKGGGSDSLSIVSMDDPEHARQRRLVSRGFTPSRITQLMDHIRELAASWSTVSRRAASATSWRISRSRCP